MIISLLNYAYAVIRSVPENSRARWYKTTANRGGLAAVSTPNPCDVHHSQKYEPEPFPYMWYFRTELRNKTTEKIRIEWFQAFTLFWGVWIPGNVMGRPLTSEDFSKWYSEGCDTSRGEIGAGAVAACDPNWHGSSEPEMLPIKWAFYGRDEKGTTYYAETIIYSTRIEPAEEC